MATVGEKDLLVAPPPPINSDQILSEYPLHWYVWNKDASSIEEELALARVSVDFTSLHRGSVVVSASLQISDRRSAGQYYEMTLALNLLNKYHL